MIECAVTSVPITEGPAFKRGVQYEVANGVRIPSLGENKFTGFMGNGVAGSLAAHVCAVNECLMSASKIAKAGNRFIVDGEGDPIERTRRPKSKAG